MKMASGTANAKLSYASMVLIQVVEVISASRNLGSAEAAAPYGFLIRTRRPVRVAVVDGGRILRWSPNLSFSFEKNEEASSAK